MYTRSKGDVRLGGGTIETMKIPSKTYALRGTGRLLVATCNDRCRVDPREKELLDSFDDV
jgi:hypothetical protein